MDIGKLIFKCIVGSHAYGTNIEGSDKDIKGVFIQNPKDMFLNGYKEQYEVSADEVYYELGRFLELCKTANPTMLELLFTPADCIIEITDEFKLILDNKDRFITQKCKHSFSGYAYSQIQKAGGLEKKMNWAESRKVRKSVSDFCFVYVLDDTYSNSEMFQYSSESIRLKEFLKVNSLSEENCGLVSVDHMKDTYLLFYNFVKQVSTTRTVIEGCRYNGISSEDSNEVCLSEIPNYCSPIAMLYFNRDAYSIHCKEYKEYTDWLENRNTQRYVDIEGHNQKIDGKNLLHCVRLIRMGVEIGKGEGLNVRRSDAEYLIDIRKGKFSLDKILNECKEDIESMKDFYIDSTLPYGVDEKWFNAFLREIRLNVYVDLR